MDEMTLEELVAQHLSGETSSAWSGLSDGTKEFWITVARRCLRLMEWARRQGCNSAQAYMEREKVYSIVVETGESLTLPPDEWQP